MRVRELILHMVEILVVIVILALIVWLAYAFVRMIYHKIMGLVYDYQYRRDTKAEALELERQRKAARSATPRQSHRSEYKRKSKASEPSYQAPELASLDDNDEDEDWFDSDPEPEPPRRELAVRRTPMLKPVQESVTRQRGFLSDGDARERDDRRRRGYKLKHNVREFNAFAKGLYSLTPTQCNDLWTLRKNKEKSRNVTGVYILHNETQDRYYVGQSIRVFHRVRAHFTGSKNGNADVYRDYMRGDHWSVQIVRLRDTTYDNLDDLERHSIELYDAVASGYNAKQGNGDWVTPHNAVFDVLPNSDEYFGVATPVKKQRPRVVPESTKQASQRPQRVRRSTRSTRAA